MRFGRTRKLKLWQLYLFGPLLIFLAIWTYRDLAAFEAEGGTRYLGRFTALLYDIGGKNFVLVFYLACGAFYVVALLRYRRLEREAKLTSELDEQAGARRRKERPLVKPPLPSPPRVTDDPFRSPPQTIVVESPRYQAPPPPIVPSDSAPEPSLLK